MSELNWNYDNGDVCQVQEFWTTLLVGKKIVDLEWEDPGVKALILEDGHRIMITDSGYLCVKIPESERAKQPQGGTSDEKISSV